MPIAFNPPPLPSPDNVRAMAADANGDAGAAPGDAFSRLLQAAGAHRPAHATGKTDTPAGKPNALTGKPDTAKSMVDDDAGRVQLGVADTPNTVIAPVPSVVVAAGDATPSKSPSSERDSGDSITQAPPVLALASLAVGLAPTTRVDARYTPAPTATDELVPAARGEKRMLGLQEAGTQQFLNVAADTPVATSTATPTPAAQALSLLREGATEGKMAPAKADVFADLPPLALPSPAPTAQTTGVAAVPVVLSIDAMVGTPAWQGELGSKLGQVIMLRNERAEFHMHPAHLGPVDIQINIAADQASLLITAPQAATREALEQALPHLRNMLANQGITLGQASVQSDQRQASAFAERAAVSALSADSTAMPGLITPAARVVDINRLIDVFA